MFLFFLFWTVLLVRVYLPSSWISTLDLLGPTVTAWTNWKRHGVFSASLPSNYTSPVLYSKFRDHTS